MLMTGKYITNDENKHALTNCIKNLILSSKEYIKISSFLIQDAGIVDLLKDLSSTGKIAVFLISNKKNQESEEYIESVVNSKEKENSGKSVGFDNHGKFLKEFYYSGIHVHLLDNLHAKFIISDGRKGLIMSANLAPNSLGRNVESGIEIYGDDVKQLEYVFDNMYKHADIVRYQGSFRKDVTVKVDNKLLPNKVEHINGNIKLTIASSYNSNLSLCKVNTIYSSIIDIINRAQEYLYIVTWHFKLNENALDEFICAVKKAIDRGVKVNLYSNTKTDVPSLKSSLKAINKLERLGCRSYGDDKNHSKCVISESEGILFTANIDGISGMLSGFEVGYIMNNEQRIDAKRHIERAIKITKYGK